MSAVVRHKEAHHDDTLPLRVKSLANKVLNDIETSHKQHRVVVSVYNMTVMFAL